MSVSTDQMTIYSTPWCGYCSRLKQQLKRAGISFAEVDIEQDPASEELVKKINNGNAVVPTVIFTDGSSLTNPSIKDVEARLSAAV